MGWDGDRHSSRGNKGILPVRWSMARVPAMLPWVTLVLTCLGIFCGGVCATWSSATVRSGESRAVAGPSLRVKWESQKQEIIPYGVSIRDHPAVSSPYHKVKVQSHGMLARVGGIQGVGESNKSRQGPVNHHGVKVTD